MNSKLITAMALVSLGAQAQATRYSEEADFGGQRVTLRVTNAYFFAVNDGEAEPLEARFAGETDPAEKERLAQRLFELGDAEMLGYLAQAHERRMDLVGAYAYWYALNKLAKMNAHRLAPDAKVRGPYFTSLEKAVERVGSRISAAQRASGIKRAAQIIRDNPNCCMVM